MYEDKKPSSTFVTQIWLKRETKYYILNVFAVQCAILLLAVVYTSMMAPTDFASRMTANITL